MHNVHIFIESTMRDTPTVILTATFTAVAVAVKVEVSVWHLARHKQNILNST